MAGMASISQLRFSPYTTYYNSFFLLRTSVTIGGQLAEIGYSQSSELTLADSHYPDLSVSFLSIYNNLETILKKYGVSHISNFLYEEVPLFQVNFSEHGLRKFVDSKQEIQTALEFLFSEEFSKLPTPGAPPRKIPTTVQTQLFLISPDAVKKGAKVIAVTLENHSTCMTLWKESELFDYRSLFHDQEDSSNNQKQVTLKALVSELHEVADWFHMGVHMNVSESELLRIKHNCLNVLDDCKIEMLIRRMWQKPPLTWSAVARVLEGMKMMSLANKISLKYGVTSSEESVPQKTVHDDYMQELEKHDTKLAEIDRDLEKARKEKDTANDKHTHSINNLTAAHNRTKRLLLQRRENAQQLKIMEKELQYLQFLEEQQEENKELRPVIDGKKSEISQLRGNLESIDWEIAIDDTQEAHLEQLQQATNELVKNCVLVGELESMRAKVVADLKSERRKVDLLLMQSAATTTGEGLMKEVETQMADAEKRYENSDLEMESHQQAVTQKDDKISRLSKEVQTLEAQLQEVLEQQAQTSKVEVEEKLHQLAVETSDLRVQLAEAEGEKLEAVRRLEAVQREKREMEQWIEELKTKDVSQSPPPGVDFLGPSFDVTVDSSGKGVQWEDHNISAVIPPNAVPEDSKAVLQGQCCIGPFVPPEGSKFVSPVYLVSTSCRFQSELEATISHFANLKNEDDCSSMTFVTASSIPTIHDQKPQYRFKPIPGGTFQPHETKATIRLKHCSFIGIVAKDDTGVLYTSIFWSPRKPLVDTPHAIFSVMPLHREYENALQQRIQNQFPDEHFTTTSYTIDYSCDGKDAAVKLIIPHEELYPHYKVVSDNPTAKIFRSQVDDPYHWYRGATVESSISYPPWIWLTISSGDECPTQPLDCTLPVEGAWIAGTTDPCKFSLRLPHALQPLSVHSPSSHQGQPLPFSQLSTAYGQEGDHPVFERRPTMLELQLLEWKEGNQEKELRLIKTIANKWKALRDRFDISQAAIDERQTHEDCCHDVLEKWLESGSQTYPVTWGGLYRALVDIEHRIAAKDLQTALLSNR